MVSARPHQAGQGREGQTAPRCPFRPFCMRPPSARSELAGVCLSNRLTVTEIHWSCGFFKYAATYADVSQPPTAYIQCRGSQNRTTHRRTTQHAPSYQAGKTEVTHLFTKKNYKQTAKNLGIDLLEDETFKADPGPLLSVPRENWPGPAGIRGRFISMAYS